MYMYAEMPVAIYEKIKPALEERRIRMSASDCTPKGFSGQLMHLDFHDRLTRDEIALINDLIDRANTEHDRQSVMKYEELSRGIGKVHTEDIAQER